MRSLNWNVREAARQDFKDIGMDAVSISMRAWALDVGDKLVGIGGVFLKKGAWTAFVRVVDDKDIPKPIIVKAMKIGFSKILSMKLPTLCAIKEKELKTADNLLNHFGFNHISTVGGEEIYIWGQR